MKKYQWVNWFPSWQGIGFYRWTNSMRLVYRWSILMGWFEIRRWRNNENNA